MKRVAVVGAGIFGVSVALRLARDGEHRVDLFDRLSDILMAASGINQYRLHRGYHYPRSDETTLALTRDLSMFEEEYGDAVMTDVEHYYCISREGSLTPAEDYKRFCIRHQLEFEETTLGLVAPEQVALTVRVRESLFDPEALRHICHQKLDSSDVHLNLDTEIDAGIFGKGYDEVVFCSYAGINEVLQPESPRGSSEYQFEICEKPVIRLPREFDGKSIVVMDGPFMCVDPYGKSGLFVAGNVVHAIHSTTVGTRCDIPDEMRPLLNSGVIKDPPLTNFEQFVRSAARFMPAFEEAEHVGSMFTVRAVLPRVDATDERPTIVSRTKPGEISVFAGKIANCVQAAEDVARLIAIA